MCIYQNSSSPGRMNINGLRSRQRILILVFMFSTPDLVSMIVASIRWPALILPLVLMHILGAIT